MYHKIYNKYQIILEKEYIVNIILEIMKVQNLNQNLKQKYQKQQQHIQLKKMKLIIFNFEKYNIICKIDREITIFIGQDKKDNEVLLDQFFKKFET